MLSKVFLSVRWGVSMCPSVPDQDSDPDPKPHPLSPTEGEGVHQVFTCFDRRAALFQKKTTSCCDFSSASFPRVLHHVLRVPVSPPSIHVRLFIAIEGRHNIGSAANQRGNTRTGETGATLQGSLRRRHSGTQSAGGPEC